MPQWLRAAVHRIVFRRRYELEILRIIALQSFHELHAHACGQERILAERLHTPPPARIAIDIDIRRPERKSRKPAVIVVADRLVILGAPLHRNHVCNPAHQRGVHRRRQANRLRKIGCESVARHSMQCLVPPVVCGNAQPWNCWRNVLHLTDLLFERHAAHEVLRARLWRQRGVQVRTRRSATGCLLLMCRLLCR